MLLFVIVLFVVVLLIKISCVEISFTEIISSVEIISLVKISFISYNLPIKKLATYYSSFPKYHYTYFAAIEELAKANTTATNITLNCILEISTYL